MEQRRYGAQGGARNAGERNKEDAFIMLQGLGPTNTKESSRLCKLDIAASKMAARLEGTKRGDCEVGLTEKGEESGTE